jgi:hypothetical protein
VLENKALFSCEIKQGFLHDIIKTLLGEKCGTTGSIAILWQVEEKETESIPR